MDDNHKNEDHDQGLVSDLALISRQLFERRRALTILSGSGVSLLASCGGGTASSFSTISTASAGSSSSSSSSSSSGGSGSCIADPAETSGPYPADGTNTSSGTTSNILTASGIVRSDIRSSFLTDTTSAAGVLVNITITLVNADSSCEPLSGYAIYFWHCDSYGHYSLYSAPTESYLRGVQVTNSLGQVTFTTFFPGCYAGRWPHYHFEVFKNLTSATIGTAAVLTSQFAMPAAVCDKVYDNTLVYPTSALIFNGVSLSTDNVFGDNTSAQITQMTPAFTGNVADGYVATVLVGI